MAENGELVSSPPERPRVEIRSCVAIVALTATRATQVRILLGQAWCRADLAHRGADPVRVSAVSRTGEGDRLAGRDVRQAPSTVRAMEPADLAAALDGHPATAGVDLLVLHGSRARGDAAPSSDWDLGYLAGSDDADPLALVAAVTAAVGTDDVDLVDLSSASALLRFRAARDGQALLERRRDAFLDFRLEAVRFWCDVGPVIRAAQADVLASLG